MKPFSEYEVTMRHLAKDWSYKNEEDRNGSCFQTLHSRLGRGGSSTSALIGKEQYGIWNKGVLCSKDWLKSLSQGSSAEWILRVKHETDQSLQGKDPRQEEWLLETGRKGWEECGTEFRFLYGCRSLVPTAGRISYARSPQDRARWHLVMEG